MSDQDAKDLIKRYNEGRCTPQEKIIVEQWFLSVSRQALQKPVEAPVESAAKSRIWAGIAGKTNRKVIKAKRWYWAAAALLVAFSALFYFNTQRVTEPAVAALHHYRDISPGRERAILTLSNGRQIALQPGLNQLDMVDGGVKIVSASKNSLSYERQAHTHNKTETTYNTITTPNASEYHIQLADGTKVWLNAASTMTYPTMFSGNSRDVTVNGEAYFEVAKDKNRPFHVKIGNSRITVLGTHFNINAYPEESAVKVSLIEGSVGVERASHAVVIKPGEQAVLKQDGIAVEKPDMDQVMAWKSGLFNFKQASIPYIMSQLGRWYDAKIEVRKALPNIKFSGKIYRNVNASEIVEILNYSGIRCQIQSASDNGTQNKIIVNP